MRAFIVILGVVALGSCSGNDHGGSNGSGTAGSPGGGHGGSSSAGQSAGGAAAGSAGDAGRGGSSGSGGSAAGSAGTPGGSSGSGGTSPGDGGAAGSAGADAGTSDGYGRCSAASDCLVPNSTCSPKYGCRPPCDDSNACHAPAGSTALADCVMGYCVLTCSRGVQTCPSDLMCSESDFCVVP